MTIEKAIELLDQEWKKSVGDYRYQNPQKLDREYALDMAIVALKEKLARDNPEALTLDQLREMDGEPVWAHHLSQDDWLWEGWHIWRHCSMVLDNYGKTWIAYAHKPRTGDKPNE